MTALDALAGPCTTCHHPATTHDYDDHDGQLGPCDDTTCTCGAYTGTAIPWVRPTGQRVRRIGVWR